MYSVTLQALAHDALRRALLQAKDADKKRGRATAPSLCAVDGTAGNGHDTLFLAQCVGEGGQVWAFDVQERALAVTRSRLEGEGVGARAQLILDGHEHLNQYLPQHQPIHGAMFNLGYLPGEARAVVTRPQTTLAALHALLARLASGGVLSVHIYTGHEGGEGECTALLPWAAALPHPLWHVLHIHSANKPVRAEHLLLISRA